MRLGGYKTAPNRPGIDRRSALRLAAGAAASLPGAFPARAQRGRTLRVSMTVPELGDPRLFDMGEQGDLARGVIEPLVRLDADGTFRPWLLERWEVAPDAGAYRLHLRQGVRWSTGDAFDARDALANFTRWCDADAPGNSMAARLDALIDPQTRHLRAGAVEAEGAHVVRLTLSRPDATLIAALTDYPALVVHRDHDPARGDPPSALAGTGPFRIETHAPGAFARLVSAPQPWWGGAVGLDAVEFLDLGADPAAEVAAFARGEIDLNRATLPAFAPTLDALGLTAHRALSGATVVARMNLKAEPYADRRIRRALQLLVDNETVRLIAHRGLGLAAENHHVGPMHPEYAPLPPPARDPDAARALLLEAGSIAWPFELVSIDDDWRSLTADAIAAQLRDGGLTVRRRIVPAAEHRAAWKSYAFSITDWASRPLGVQTLALAYRSGAAWNETGFSDPAFDALLDAALGEPDPERRIAPVRELQRILQDSGAIIQPYWRSAMAHAAPHVRGFRLHPAQELHLEGVSLA
ncbi:MAG: ABC transporter substrate-binding protein [Rubrimonas sp.]|uniref:ABC transporter substrate-binding protein n=1 Tax=Rubrimonas sp. TaxID=2036015 RepID=UPI002FDD0DA7